MHGPSAGREVLRVSIATADVESSSAGCSEPRGRRQSCLCLPIEFCSLRLRAEAEFVCFSVSHQVGAWMGSRGRALKGRVTVV